MKRVYILSCARTPSGVIDGNLRDYKEARLGAKAMNLALELGKFEAENLSEIIVGTAKQTSDPSNLARHTMLEARLPDIVPAYTVQRQSASGIQAIANGTWSIRSGNAQAVLAGGCESMTHIPLEIHDARFKFNEHTRIIFDPIAAQVEGAQPENLTSEGICESIAKKYSITDDDMKAFAAESAVKTATRAPQDYICKLQVRKGKVFEPVESDETTTEPGIIAKPADGAAMLLLASEEVVKYHNLPDSDNTAPGYSPLAEILSITISAGDPSGDGLVDSAAVIRALDKSGLDLAGLSRIEIVEMNAAQVLATIKNLGLDTKDARINPQGGGLSTGSAWGASGVMQLADMLHSLNSGESGVMINPAEGGQLMCAVIKRI